jgi:hypothetical protein
MTLSDKWRPLINAVVASERGIACYDVARPDQLMASDAAYHALCTELEKENAELMQARKVAAHWKAASFRIRELCQRIEHRLQIENKQLRERVEMASACPLCEAYQVDEHTCNPEMTLKNEKLGELVRRMPALLDNDIEEPDPYSVGLTVHFPRYGSPVWEVELKRLYDDPISITGDPRWLPEAAIEAALENK